MKKIFPILIGGLIVIYFNQNSEGIFLNLGQFPIEKQIISSGKENLYPNQGLNFTPNFFLSHGVSELDPNIDLNLTYSEEDWESIALTSPYILTKAIALTQIRDSNFLTEFVNEYLEKWDAGSGYLYRALLNNPNLSQESLYSIINSFRVNLDSLALDQRTGKKALYDTRFFRNFSKFQELKKEIPAHFEKALQQVLFLPESTIRKIAIPLIDIFLTRNDSYSGISREDELLRLILWDLRLIPPKTIKTSWIDKTIKILKESKNLERRLTIAMLIAMFANTPSTNSDQKLYMFQQTKDIINNEQENPEIRFWLTDIINSIILDTQIPYENKKKLSEEINPIEIIKNPKENADVKAAMGTILSNMAEISDEFQRVVAEELNLKDKFLDIWGKFKILLISGEADFKLKEINMIERVLNSLPSNFSKGSVTSIVRMSEENLPSAKTAPNGSIRLYGNPPEDFLKLLFFHEFTHAFHARKLPLNSKLVIDKLYDSSLGKFDDYAWEHISPEKPDYYGAVSSAEDIATYITAYIHYTLNIFSRALTQAKNNNDVLLRKFELITGLFSYRKNGKLMTYIYQIDKDGKILRSEVELKKTIIKNNYYLLPVIDRNSLKWNEF
jgi:hypothetical protein